MKLVEQFDNMVGHITSINDERDVVPLLLGLQELWPQVRSEIERLRAEKVEQDVEIERLRNLADNLAQDNERLLRRAQYLGIGNAMRR